LRDPQCPEVDRVRVDVAGSLEEAPGASTVVLGVKHPDLPAITEGLGAYLARCPADALVVALQNGVVHLDGALAEAAGGRLCAGAVYIFSEVAEPGVVRVTGGPRWFRLGPADPGNAWAGERTQGVAADWSAAGIAASAEADGRQVCWEKLCLLAALSGVTALTGRTLGELRRLPDLMATVRAMAGEVAAVGRAEGMALAADIPDRVEAGLRSTDPEGRSSLWLDLSRGRPSEIDVLLGDPVRRGERHGVPVPTLRAIYATALARYGIGLTEAAVVA
jgi:2-dehydropantoate 2-reductase